MYEMYSKALRELVKKECRQIEQKIAVNQDKKYIIFPAGPTAQRFFYTLKDECGIEAEFFVDNNSKLEGKVVCGKQIKSFNSAFPKEKSFTNGKEEYIIFIPTLFKYYEQITAQLEATYNSIYFYADAFMAHRFWESYDKVACMLADELSKISYWGAIYGLMSGDNSFVTRDPSPNYFALREFGSTESEIIVDAGAYVGDTIEEYLKKASGKVKIYAFEPFKSVIDKLTERVKRLEKEWMIDDNAIEIISAGVGSETKTLRFSTGNSSMLKPDEHGEITMSIYSLDDFFKDKPAFTLLKADIEGGELDMLIGAQKIIKQHKPKMTICIYHSPQDFARIVEYIHTLVPEYRFYVRSHWSNYQDTILYCTL